VASSLCLSAYQDLLRRRSLASRSAAAAAATATAAATAAAATIPSTTRAATAQVASRQEADGADVKVSAIGDAAVGGCSERELRRYGAERVTGETVISFGHIAGVEILLCARLNLALDIEAEKLERRQRELQVGYCLAGVVDDDNLARKYRKNGNLQRAVFDLREAVGLSPITEDKTPAALFELVMGNGNDSGGAGRRRSQKRSCRKSENHKRQSTEKHHPVNLLHCSSGA